MSYGVPVVASSTSALPEVVGDAGLLVNPYSEADITAALLKMTEDRALHSELRLKALQRAEIFSWERAARETLALFKQSMENHEPRAYRHRVLEQALD